MRVRFRLLIGALLTLLLIPFVLAALMCTVEFKLPLDGQRDAIAGAVSQALGGEVSILGKLRLITGGRPGIEVHGLHIAGGLKGKRISADLGLARLRLHLSPLLERKIRLSEATVKGANVCISDPSISPSAERAPSAQPAGAWRLDEIDELGIEITALGSGPDCTALPGTAALRTLTLNASGSEALRIAAGGTIAGETWTLNLDGPALPALAGTTTTVPFKLAAEYTGGKLSAEGNFLLSPLTAEADVVFDTPQFAAQIRPLGVPFKSFGPLAIRAHVRADAKLLTLRLDEARLTPGVVRGEFSFDWSGTLARLAARARTEKLDFTALQGWLADAIDGERLHPGRLQQQIIEGVRASEGSLVLEAGQVAAGYAAFDAALVDATWKKGKAHASFGARLGRAPIKGSFDADVGADTLSLAAKATAQAVTMTKAPGLTVAANRVDAKLSARGRLGVDLDKGIRATVNAYDARLVLPREGGERHSVLLDSMNIDWQTGDTLRVTAAGTAYGEHFDAHAEGANALRLFRGEPWEVATSGAFGPLRLKAKGRLALRKGEPQVQLDLTASSDGLRSLVPHAIAQLPLNAHGHIELQRTMWRVNLASLRLGKTNGVAEIDGSVPFAARPLAVQARFDTLDLTELASQSGGGDTGERQLLPSRLILPDADLTFSAARVVVPGDVILEIKANAKTRGGRLEQLPFALEMDGASIQGNVAADLRQDTAQVSATIEAGNLERLLSGDRGIRVKIGNAKVSAQTKGNRPRELAANAELQIELRDANVAIERRGKDHQLGAALSEAALSAAPGSPTRLQVRGEFAGQPLSVEASGDALAAWFARDKAPYAYSLSGRITGLDVAANGDLPADRKSAKGKLDVRISAARLDALNTLLDTDLPSVGPFTLEAVRRKSDTGEAADIKVALGETRVAGRVASRRVREQPAFDIDLTSALLRLEDLGASATKTERAQEAKPKSHVEPSAKHLEHAQAILDEMRDGLRRVDLRMHLALPHITWSGAEIGRARVVAKLESGRLQLAPFRYDGAGGGSIDIDLDANMAGELASYRLKAAAHRLQYGPLAVSVEPSQADAGELNLYLRLSGGGALANILPSLKGEVGLSVFPSGQPSIWMNYLGGGLLRNLGSNIDTEEDSKLNCVVATFNIAAGRARSTALMVDSTRARAAGELEVDLAQGTLHGRIVPKSKRPELLNPSLPVAIRGTFADPKIAPDTGGGAAAAVRLYYFAYAYLFDAVTTRQLAEDGGPDCKATYERLTK